MSLGTMALMNIDDAKLAAVPWPLGAESGLLARAPFLD